MNVLIVPDVHGRTFWRKAKELIDQYDKVVFLGDYLDPYSYEGITPEIAFPEFIDIIEFKKANPEKVTLLLGNHDLHYVSPYFIYSSRRDYMNYGNYQKIFEDNKDLFSCFEVIKSSDNTWLFSHAGVTKEWLNQNKLSLEELLKKTLDELLDNKGIKWGSLLEQVSYYRGGDLPYGSPVWADIHEFVDDTPNLDDNITQIVGHNQLEAIVSTPGIVYTDCRRLIALDTETKKVTYA